jgi:hypothetical protein
LLNTLMNRGIPPMNRRPTTRLCPAPECLEEKRLLSTVAGLTSAPAVHVRSTHETAADPVRLAHNWRAPGHHKPTHVGAGNGSGLGGGVTNGNGNGNGSGNGGGGGFGSGGGFQTTALTLGPDSGLLAPPFGLVMVEPSALVPGAVYNMALVTVRNDTAQTLTAQSGLTFEVSGTSAAESFPVGTYRWEPGQVLILISLTEDSFAPDFTFNLQGTSVKAPANLYYGIQYSPITLPSIVTSIVPTYVVGGRYALMST